MADVTEVMSDELTKDDILRRLDDWELRISDLYRRVSNWLPPGWTWAEGRGRPMQEELMREFGVPPRILPVLDLSPATGAGRRIEPRGLWIIGTNGRLDLTGADRHFLVTDRADKFDPPDWQIAPLQNRTDREPLTESTLARALGP